DDQLDSYVDYSRDTVDNTATDITYSDPGPDMTWMTADDIPSNYAVSELESHGSTVRSTNYGPGLDGMWGTADDAPTQYVAYTYDDHGNRLTQLFYDSPGDDGVWHTADDQKRRERT